MQWRKTKFRIGYRAFSSDREQALYRVMKRLDTLQEVEILVSRMVDGELVEGEMYTGDLTTHEMVAFDVPSQWIGQFFDATNEEMVTRPPTPPSSEPEPTTEVELPGAVIGPENWKFRVEVRVDNSNTWGVHCI
jgi:hypothetical protein